MFKKGDKIIGKKSASEEYSVTVEGWIGEVLEVEYNEILVKGEKGETHWVNGKYFKLLKKYKKREVNFLLKYDLDEDPIEEFETMKEVDDRIKYLVENVSSLKKDSMVIYEVKSKKEVKVSTRITKKLVK